MIFIGETRTCWSPIMCASPEIPSAGMRICSISQSRRTVKMRHYYQTELEQAVDRFRATMAAYQGPWAIEPRIVAKGKTLYVIKGQREELRTR